MINLIIIYNFFQEDHILNNKQVIIAIWKMIHFSSPKNLNICFSVSCLNLIFSDFEPVYFFHSFVKFAISLG